ncbi:hypothetical protein QBC44DRAFT_96244 [Cladorrhinum sp. PSN332]|nr:hypothetical protein QBC44DRAFT_96244 [Cladorrhinum sp. PSN332]
METSTTAEPTPVATSSGLNSDTSSTMPELTKPTETETPSSAMDPIPDNKPVARVGFQHAPLPFRGAKEETVEGEWAKSFADRRSYTGWSIAAGSTFTDYTEPDLESPGFATDDAFDSYSEIGTPALSRTSSIPVQVQRQQSFCPPSRVSSFASVDRFGSSPDNKAPIPNLPWQRRPADMAPSPRRSRLSSLNIPQLGSGLVRDLSHPSPIAEDAKSAFDSDDEEEQEQKDSAHCPADDKGKDVEVISRSDALPVDLSQKENVSPRSEKSDDQFHSSSGADTPDSMSEAGALSSHRPDDGLVQDISDRVLKHMFGIELGDLPQGRASAAFESISYCLEELSHIITLGSPQNSGPSLNQAGRESAYHPNISIQPASGDGGSGYGGMGGASPGGDNGKGRARKRPENERDDDEEDDEDGDDGHRQPGGKRQKVEPRFSCPFRKRNPIKFNVREFTSCATQDFPDMPQLKRHIKNIHGKKALAQLQCPRCKQTFESNEALTEHSTRPAEFMCSVQDERQNSNPEDGITNQIEDLLNGRKANSKVDRWDALWHVLFPDDPAEAIPSPEFIPPTELDEVHRDFKMSYNSLAMGIGQHFDELKQHMQQDKDQAIRYMLQLFQRHTELVFDSSRTKTAKTASTGYARKQRNHHNLKPRPSHSRRGSATRSIHRIQSTETIASHNDHSGIPSSMGTPESGNQFQRPPPLQTNTPSPGYHGPMSASPGGFHGGINTNALSPDALTTPVNPLTGMPVQFPVTIGGPAQGGIPAASHLGSPMQPQISNHRRVPTGDSGVSFGPGAFNMSPNAGAVAPNAVFGALPVRQQGLGVNYQPGSAGTSPINEVAFFGGPQQQMQMRHQQQRAHQQQLTQQQFAQLQFAQQQRLHYLHQQGQQPMAPQLPLELQLPETKDFGAEEWPDMADFAMGGPGLMFPQSELEVRIQPPSNPVSRLNSDHSPQPAKEDQFFG